MTKPRYFTNSELALARRCWRKWYLTQYRRLYRKRERINESSYTGDLVHDAVAEFYNSGGQQDPLSQIVLKAETDREHQRSLTGSGDENDLIIQANIELIDSAEELARIMVEGYLEWLEEEGADSYLRFISAEEEKHIVFPADGMPKPGAHLLAKLDARFHDQRTDARVFMDHKTVQNFADREKWAHLDPQFLFYALIEFLDLQANGEEGEWTDGGIVNMLRKVKRTARAKPPFYKRLEVRHSVVELRHYFVRVAGEISRIQQAEIALDQGIDHRMVCPPNPTRDCSWDCAHMQLCGMMDDGSDVELYIEAVYEQGDPLRRYDTVEG